MTTTATTTTTTESIAETNPERVRGSTFVPREIIKFELADAKIPDFQQQQRYQPKQTNARPTQRQRKAKRRETTTEAVTDVKSSSSNDETEKTLGDQSSSDSRVLMTRANVKQLPFSVQKAINHALKLDYNIPFLDTIKYYFKDPHAKTATKTVSGVDRLPAGAKLVSDSRIRQWWQLPPSLKATSTNGLARVSPTTVKPLVSSASNHYVNDAYVAYPLLRTYPVQYSMNVASDLVNGVGFLYGDRIYSKPYTYQKNVNSIKSSDIKPVVEPKPFGEEDIVQGVYTPTAPTSSLLLQPTSEATPKTHSFVKYYSAELPSIPTDPDTGIPLSNDKNTINLINKAVNELKKHNPHLNVIPKRLEKDELVVHVTPKPDYFTAKVTTQRTILQPSAVVHQTFKDIAADKNLVYLNKVANSVAKPHIAGHAFITHVEVPHNYDDLVHPANIFIIEKLNESF